MATSSRASRSSATSAARPRSRSRAASHEDQAPAAAPDVADAEVVAATTPDGLRRQWIAEAAYYIAERRGFRGGSPDEDWCEAEAEIDRMLASTRH